MVGCNPQRAGGWRVQGYPQLYIKCDASLDYMNQSQHKAHKPAFTKGGTVSPVSPKLCFPSGWQSAILMQQ